MERISGKEGYGGVEDLEKASKGNQGPSEPLKGRNTWDGRDAGSLSAGRALGLPGRRGAEPASLFICIVTFLPVISSALFLRILTPDSFKPACLILLKGPIPKHLSLSRPLRFSLDQQAQPALHFRGPFE